MALGVRPRMPSSPSATSGAVKDLLPAKALSTDVLGIFPVRFHDGIMRVRIGKAVFYLKAEFTLVDIQLVKLQLLSPSQTSFRAP